jgi:hypothetical protein
MKRLPPRSRLSCFPTNALRSTVAGATDARSLRMAQFRKSARLLRNMFLHLPASWAPSSCVVRAIGELLNHHLIPFLRNVDFGTPGARARRRCSWRWRVRAGGDRGSCAQRPLARTPASVDALSDGAALCRTSPPHVKRGFEALLRRLGGGATKLFCEKIVQHATRSFMPLRYSNFVWSLFEHRHNGQVREIRRAKRRIGPISTSVTWRFESLATRRRWATMDGANRSFTSAFVRHEKQREVPLELVAQQTAPPFGCDLSHLKSGCACSPLTCNLSGDTGNVTPRSA